MAELDVTPAHRCAQRVHAGLCARCRHLRLMSNGRSMFIRCGLADGAAQPHAWPRYPRLPVVDCRGFESSG